MRRLGSGFVLGLLLLALGAAIAIHLIIDIQIPILASVVSFLLLLWGSNLVAGGWMRHEYRTVHGESWLSRRVFAPAGLSRAGANYDVILGSGVVDLTKLARPETDLTISVDTILGSSVVKVDPTVAYDVKVDSTFGEVRTPSTRPPGRDRTEPRPRLHLRLMTVLGSCRLEEVRPPAS